MQNLFKETPLTVTQAAERVGVTRATVRRWIISGLPLRNGERPTLEAYRVGRDRRTTVQAVDRFLAEVNRADQEAKCNG